MITMMLTFSSPSGSWSWEQHTHDANANANIANICILIFRWRLAFDCALEIVWKAGSRERAGTAECHTQKMKTHIHIILLWHTSNHHTHQQHTVQIQHANIPHDHTPIRTRRPSINWPFLYHDMSILPLPLP